MLDIVQTIEEVEALIKRAEPKVEMIFLEAAHESESDQHDVVPQHIG